MTVLLMLWAITSALFLFGAWLAGAITPVLLILGLSGPVLVLLFALLLLALLFLFVKAVPR